MINAIIAVCFSMFLLVSGYVHAGTLTVDPAQSSLLFNIHHDLGYTVGYFNNITATLEMSDESKVVGATVLVKTGSVNTRNSLRDEGLKSSLFLDAGQFPEATFESSKIEGDQIAGTLTIKGIAKPATLTLEQDAAGKKVILKGAFNRHDYGITYNSILANKKKSIGDTVEVTVELKTL